MTTDHDTLEELDAFAAALDDPIVDFNRIPGAEFRDIFTTLTCFYCGDTVHGSSCFREIVR